jgi:hypothetical protein
MDIFQTIGFAWIVLTSTLATIAFFFLAYKALTQMLLDASRGEVERGLDARDAARMRDGIPGVSER